jgi:hypothetical protein
MSVTVELLDEPLPPPLSDRLDALLAESSSPALLGYHALAYQRMMAPILGDRLRHLIAIDARDRVVGYLPFREREAAAGRALCALPFFGPNGLILVAEGAAPNVSTRLIERLRAAAEGALSVVLYTPFLAPVEPIAAAFAPDDRIDKFTQYLALAELAQWPP